MELIERWDNSYIASYSTINHFPWFTFQISLMWMKQ